MASTRSERAHGLERPATSKQRYTSTWPSFTADDVNYNWLLASAQSFPIIWVLSALLSSASVISISSTCRHGQLPFGSALQGRPRPAVATRSAVRLLNQSWIVISSMDANKEAGFGFVQRRGNFICSLSLRIPMVAGSYVTSSPTLFSRWIPWQADGHCRRTAGSNGMYVLSGVVTYDLD